MSQLRRCLTYHSYPFYHRFNYKLLLIYAEDLWAVFMMKRIIPSIIHFHILKKVLDLVNRISVLDMVDYLKFFWKMQWENQAAVPAFQDAEAKTASSSAFDSRSAGLLQQAAFSCGINPERGSAFFTWQYGTFAHTMLVSRIGRNYVLSVHRKQQNMKYSSARKILSGKIMLFFCSYCRRQSAGQSAEK